MQNATTPTTHEASPLRGLIGDGATSYALVFEASPSGLLLVAEDGRILLVNAHVEEMFGYRRAELVGQTVDMLVPDRLRGGHALLRSGFMCAAVARAMGAGREITARRRDGSEFPVEIGLNPGMRDGGACVIAAVQDVTERRTVQEALARQKLELERSNADLVEFAHAASHDLKAPLRGMAHLASWIAEDVKSGTSNPQTTLNCELLISRAERMQRLLDGLLGYAKVGHTNAVPELVNTATMIQELVGSMALRAGFSVVLEGELPVLTTLRLTLERVLQNLIENAVKHHDKASGRVTISTSMEAGWLRFSVADDGPGIAPRNQQRIFRMFQTLSNRDDSDSSGIGLAIVKKKVEMLGGVVTVQSEPPARGTCFVFTWPEKVVA